MCAGRSDGGHLFGARQPDQQNGFTMGMSEQRSALGNVGWINPFRQIRS
jgi:hypothetical protein